MAYIRVIVINFTRYDFLGEKSNASQKISERMIIQERRRDIAKRDSVREMDIKHTDCTMYYTLVY